MAHRLKRAWFARIAVGMAAVAFPLLAVGSAQAAIAGANPELTQSRPDLVSATALDSTHVDFCFDKALNNAAFTPANFTLGGYRAARSVNTATSALLEQTFNTTNQCVRVTYPTTIGDIGNYTIATVAAGAVETPSLAVTLNADSTALTVPASLSPTHNGTTGFTVGPDLVGVLADPTTNAIIYTFDQAVQATPLPTAANFGFVTPGGTVFCAGAGSPVVSGNEVIVAFTLTPFCQVSNATRATVAAGTVKAAADPLGANVPEAAIMPNSNGITSSPDLTSATLESNGQAIDYVFDKNVAVTTPGDFQADMSTGAVFGATSATVIAATGTSTTVRAVFQTGGLSMSEFNEYVVWGSVSAGAVTEASPPNIANLPDAKPSGDNAGAFARGFTTGPDAFAATVSKSTGVVTIALDQRIIAGFGPGVFAVDNTGFPIAAGTAGSVGIPTQAAGPESITVAFSPGQVTTMTNLYLANGALDTLLGQGNVDQALSVTSTASLLRAARSNHLSKRQLAARRAHIRKVERTLRAQFLRHLHHTHH
ncbi:MAG TPA: hypothetical protein VG410_11960 [Solirubrobacteraceae bacterium]|nr:hypothetical protein [Solirubrobacteraceae bacterium]